MRFVVLVLLFSLSALAMPRVAFANAPAPYSRPVGAPAGVILERASPLAVEREELVIDCAHDAAFIHADCTFKATYFLHNPTGDVEEVLGAFYAAERARQPQLTESRHDGERDEHAVTRSLDGHAADAEASPEQLARMDQIVLTDPEIAREIDDGGLELVRYPFRVTVAAGARAQLVFEGPLRPTSFQDDRPRYGYTIPAVVARHPFLTPREDLAWGSSSEDYFYLVSPLRSWAGDPEVVVRVRHHGELDFLPAPDGLRWSKTHEQNITTAHASARASSRKNVRFRLEYKPFPIVNGGPLVGLGGRIGRDEARLRVGYEVSGPDFLIYGVAAETNFQEYVTAVATIEAATPDLLIIFPSLAIGVGVPVQFRKDSATRVGVRGQFALSFPIVSVLFPIDVYPAANSSGSHVEGAFVVQASF